LTFALISNIGKRLKKTIMNDLSQIEAKELTGGAGQCATNIAFAASLGGLFGGAGAVIGAVAAATGPACLGLW
jgi:hypothetical protein